MHLSPRALVGDALQPLRAPACGPMSSPMSSPAGVKKSLCAPHVSRQASRRARARRITASVPWARRAVVRPPRVTNEPPYIAGPYLLACHTYMGSKAGQSNSLHLQACCTYERAALTRVRHLQADYTYRRARPPRKQRPPRTPSELGRDTVSDPRRTQEISRLGGPRLYRGDRSHYQASAALLGPRACWLYTNASMKRHKSGFI